MQAAAEPVRGASGSSTPTGLEAIEVPSLSLTGPHAAQVSAVCLLPACWGPLVHVVFVFKDLLLSSALHPACCSPDQVGDANATRPEAPPSMLL